MKKLILALLAAGTLVTARAQEPKSILLFGDLGLSTNRDSTQVKNTVWDANIGVGYQFNQNWTIGLKIMWGQNAVKLADTVSGLNGQKYTTNDYSVGPFARYSHYIRKSEIFFYYTQMDFDYQGGYSTNEGNPTYAKNSGVFVDLYPAIGINVGRGLAMNFSIGGIGYSSLKYSSATYADNAFNFSFGKMMNVGLSKNFNAGHKMHSHSEPGDEVHQRKADSVEDEDDAAPKPKKKNKDRDEDE